jgi:hypothetical protein
MRETWLYRLALRLFPHRDEAGKTDWQALKRCDIYTGAALYLRRFILLKTPWGGVYLHHIVRSDWDRCLHDHPWGFRSLMLWGGYHEETPVDTELGCHPVYRQPTLTVLTSQRRTRWYGVGSLRYVPAHFMHRVLLRPRYDRFGYGGRVGDPETPAWTLVFVTPKTRKWGFWKKGGWVDYQTFFGGDREC